MKPLPTITVIALTMLLIAFLLHSNRSLAQQSSSADDQSGNSKFLELEGQLIKNGQTNLVVQVAEVVAEVQALQNAIEIDTYFHLLQNLRKGQTNEAINLLESKIDGNLIGYGYRTHFKYMDEEVKAVKKYRQQYPHTAANSYIDEGVSNALQSVSP